MRTYCLALCVAAALVGAVTADCDACIDGRCYRKHLLPGTSDRYGALYRKTNMLYHYYKNSNHEEIIMQCNLDTATCNDTARISGVVDLTVDQRTGDVYGTCFDDMGIYKLDLINDRKVLWVPARSVWQMTFKDKLYYSTHSGGIYVFENGVSRLFAGTERYKEIKEFIVDKHDDIYFYHYEGWHGRFLKRLSKGVIYGSGFWDNYNFQLFVDSDDNAIFIERNTRAIYRLTNGQLVEVGAVTWQKHILFDRDNNPVYYQFDRMLKYEAWHFKQERNIHCATCHIGYYRSIYETE